MGEWSQGQDVVEVSVDGGEWSCLVWCLQMEGNGPVLCGVCRWRTMVASSVVSADGGECSCLVCVAASHAECMQMADKLMDMDVASIMQEGRHLETMRLPAATPQARTPDRTEVDRSQRAPDNARNVRS